jgi:hypothetical protein
MANAWMIKPLPIMAAAASGTAVSTDPSYVGNDYAGIVWQSGGEAAPWLRIDLGADVAIDTILLFGLAGLSTANLVSIAVATAAQGAGFGAGAYTDFAVAAPALAGSTMPTSGRGVGLFSAGSAITGRYLRIGFTGLGGAIQIARAAIGRRIQLERNFAYGAAFGVKDLGSLEFNRRGVMSRSRGKKMRTVGLSFSNIYKDEVEAVTGPLLEQIGNTEMLALVTDPSADAQRQNRCYFGPLVGDLSHTRRNAKAWEAKVNQVSIF